MGCFACADDGTIGSMAYSMRVESSTGLPVLERETLRGYGARKVALLSRVLILGAAALVGGMEKAFLRCCLSTSAMGSSSALRLQRNHSAVLASCAIGRMSA